MKRTGIFVDYNHVEGKIKPMHCGNGGPRCGGEKLRFDFSDEFIHMGIPYSRLHDIEYPYGSNQFVDIHCIFPDFDADVNSPELYDFYLTDGNSNERLVKREFSNTSKTVFYFDMEPNTVMFVKSKDLI